MLETISPYVGLAAAVAAVAIGAIDHRLRVGGTRALTPVPVVNRRADADITRQLPVVHLPPRHPGTAVPPLPPDLYRRPSAPPLRPQPRARRHRPDRPAAPRSEARLITPWGDVTRLPGTDEPGIVPSTLAARER